VKRALPIVFVLLAILFPVVLAVVVLAPADRTGKDDGDGSSATPIERPEDAGARTPADPGLTRFYDQKLAWSACRDGDECATLEVPLDYSHPDGKTIGIAVLRNAVDRPSERVGDLVVNPGGPGAPGTDYAATSSDYPNFPSTIYRHYDVIGFDPRGTGASAPVDCLSDSQLDGFVAADPDPDTPAEVQEFVKESDEFGPGCERRSGDLYHHLSTHDAARDMDVLRAALGDGHLDYLGASYGTKLGATYADLFPQRVGRMVLDGAVDPTLSALDSSLQQAHGFQVAIEAYVDHCIKEGDCYLGNTRQAALQRIRDFLDQVDAKPLRVGTRELTSGTAFLGIITPLYNNDYWSYLDQALAQALKGDGRGLLGFADVYTSRKQGGGYTDNSAEAIYAINCDDDPSSVAPEKIPDLFPRFEKESPTFGRIFAWGMIGCRSLGPPKGTPEPDWHLDAKGAAPILVIGTTRDPATPLAWAKALASQLESGVLITRDGDGHTGFNMGNSCVDDAVEEYLIKGKVPQHDLTC
jgi:pimeloyl-ACP methyl ester carboxylesterase